MPIEQVAPEMERILSSEQEIEILGSGYWGRPGGPAEGPVWWREGGYLLFTDIRASKIMKWAPGEGVSVFREPTNESNGLTRDLQGRLIACEHASRRVTRTEHDGSITVVANNYRGTRLDQPNDVVVKSDGSIYFTDPWVLAEPKDQVDLDFAGVYRVSADLGTISLLVDDFVLPNGLAFSPDEKVLYVDDSRRMQIRAFDVQSNGTLGRHTDRVFYQFERGRPGTADGMKVDEEGNVYSTGPGGVWVIDPSGKHLGTILTGADQTTNVAFGGEDRKTLFITTRDVLGRVRVNIPGISVPTDR